MPSNAKKMAKAAAKSVAMVGYNAGKQAAKSAGLGELFKMVAKAAKKAPQKTQTQRKSASASSGVPGISLTPVPSAYRINGPLTSPPKVTEKHGVTTVEGREFWGFPGSTGDNFNLAFAQEIDVNTILQKLGLSASVFNEAQIAYLSVVWQPDQGTQASGNVYVGSTVNPQDEDPTNQRDFLGYPHKVFNKGIPGEWVMAASGPFTSFDNKWKKISTQISGSPGPADLQSLFFGKFFVASESCGADAKLGNLFLEYVVHFRGSSTNALRGSSDLSISWEKTMVGDAEEDEDLIPYTLFQNRRLPRGISVKDLPGTANRRAFQFMVPGRYRFTLVLTADEDYPNLQDVALYGQRGNRQGESAFQLTNVFAMNSKSGASTTDNVRIAVYEADIEQLQYVVPIDSDTGTVASGIVRVDLSWVRVR